MICDRELRNEVVLWNIGSVEQFIMKVISEFLSEDGLTCKKYHENQELPDLSNEIKYLLFYFASDEIEENRAREIGRKLNLNISFAALCENYEEGILSMRKGDFYALCLPLEQEKIVKCCKNFISD